MFFNNGSFSHCYYSFKIFEYSILIYKSFQFFTSEGNSLTITTKLPVSIVWWGWELCWLFPFFLAKKENTMRYKTCIVHWHEMWLLSFPKNKENPKNTNKVNTKVSILQTPFRLAKLFICSEQHWLSHIRIC